MTPNQVLIFGILLSGQLLPTVVDGQPAFRSPGADRHPLLCLRLYCAPQTQQHAEHRDRRRGRRSAASGGLGRGLRRNLAACRLSLYDRLLLDAATLLGAGPAAPEGIRHGRHARAARHRRPARDAPADFDLQRPAHAHQHDRSSSATSGRSTCSFRWRLTACFCSKRSTSTAARPTPTSGGSTSTACSAWRCSSSAWAWIASSTPLHLVSACTRLVIPSVSEMSRRRRDAYVRSA